jgi:hypothetical protein
MRVVAALVAVGVLAGCQSPAIPVKFRVEPGYRLQAVLAAYTSADVDHVRLTLLAAQGGTYVATGATTTVAGTALASPVTLGSLKAGTSYRIQADAYNSAGSLISDASGSQTDFATPAIATTAGVASVDDAAVPLVALKLRLADQPYAGSATVAVALSSALKSKVSTVTLKLFAGATLVSSKSYAVAALTGGAMAPLNNLRMGTSYTLQADGYNSTGQLKSTATQSTLAFTTPALGNGQVDTAVGALSVPCK